ncbi:MAG: hypothetical protein ACRBCS_03035 [Cellvibrionaceae bacterium]
MSKSTISAIIGRIKVATKDSPIAVFDIGERDFFEAVFSSTLLTEKKINVCDNFVGVFFGATGVQKFREAVKV